MGLKFTKMQGAGNDFVVFDATRRPLALAPAQIRFLADRRFGVGCDQVLLVEAPRSPGTDFYYRIFNADGGEVRQCGNGARCLARFAREHGLTERDEIRVETASGVIALRIEPDGTVTVDMGPPVLEPENVPFVADRRAPAYTVDVNLTKLEISALSMGNPHAVLRVDDVDTAPVATLGPLLERHPRFPEGANVGFLEIVERHRARLRVHERGAGETLACGTGACAAAVAGILRGWLDSPVTIVARGGELTLRWPGESQSVWLTGPAVTVFEGEINLPAV